MREPRRKSSKYFCTQEVKNRLTKREQKVFSLSLEGFTIREIGRMLGVSHIMVVKIENKIKIKCKKLEES